MSTHAADSVGAPMGMIGTPSTLVVKGWLVRDT